METDQRYNQIMEVLDRVGDRLDKLSSDRAETDKVLEDMRKDRAETEKIIKDLSKEQAKTDKQIKDINKIRGEYFMDRGEYTEMIMAPSVREMLLETYGYEYFDRNLESNSLDGKSIQIDAAAWSNGSKNEMVIIEIKTKLKEKHIDQLEKQIKYFDEYFPKLAGLKKIGMIVALEADEKLIEEVNNAGFLFAQFRDDLTVMKNRDNFKPKYF